MSDSRIGQFVIGGTMPGQPTVTVFLVVTGDQVAGVGRFSWPVSPPQNFVVLFSGKTHSTGLGPAKQLYALIGKPFPELIGAPNVPTLAITLDGVWGTSGKASYGIWLDTPSIEKFDDQPVSVKWLT